MKRLLLFITVISAFSATYAQVADKDQWTCSATHENLYDQLNAGKVVVVAMQGLDCSGCNGNAPYLDTFATNNKAKVRVWSALQLMAGSGGTCAQVANWQQTHGYNDVFTFLDTTNYWMKTYPGSEWLVIDPTDKKIKYTGFVRNEAFAEARKIFDPVSVTKVSADNKIHFYPNPATDRIHISLDKDVQLTVVSITGSKLLSKFLSKGSQTVDVSNLPSGVYLLNIIGKDVIAQSKFVKY